MEGFVYILYSQKWDQYYIGCSADLQIKLEQHNNGQNKSTKGGDPWKILYEEKCASMSLARKKEIYLKKKPKTHRVVDQLN